MPPRRFDLPLIYRRGDGFASFALSMLLHGGIVGVLIYGVYLFQAPPQEEVLPIEAELDRVTASPRIDPQPPPPAETPPQPTPEEVAQQQKEQEDKKQAQEQRQAEEAKAQAEKVAQEKAAQELAAAQEAKQKLEAERAAQEKAKAAAAAKAAQEKAAAEAKRQADLKKQVEAEEKSQREADLKKSLAQEEQADAATRAQANEARATWQSAISARIHRAWLEPPVVPQDLRCELHVTQETDGKVTNVTLGACNADEAVKESIQAAAYKASPLPAPPDPSIFDRNLFLIFKP